MTVYISTESSCDLSADVLAQHQIKVLPFYINIGEAMFRDAVDIDADELFRRAEAEQLAVHTAAINQFEYLQHFNAYPAGAEVLHISLGSGFSSSCYNAICAAEQCETASVTVIDSQNLSTGQGLLVLRAAKLAEQGLAAAEIAAVLQELIPKVEVSFILDTLEYLRRGGRCSALTALGANILNIHPTLKVSGNSLQVDKKYRGSLKRCIGQYVQGVVAEADAYDRRHAFITSAGWPDEQLTAVRELLQTNGFAPLITDAGCTVSAHCGPLCGGMVLLRK